VREHRWVLKEEVMSLMVLRARSLSSLCSVLFIFSACQTIGAYDPTSYKTATDLKAEAMLLIPKSTDGPELHKVEIEDLRLQMQKALEYEQGKGRSNNLTASQWTLLADPNGALLGGFLRKWQAEGKGQNPAFINPLSVTISAALDEIIKLESHKVKK
jgi:hypothetical protein